MAAHAAVISLKNTIDVILECSRFSVDPPSARIIRLAYNKLQPLKEILERLDSTRKNRSRKKINVVDGRIKEVLWRFEDLLDSHITDQILPQLETRQNQLRPLSSPPDELQPKRKTKTRLRKFRKAEEESREGDVLQFSLDLKGLRPDVDSFIEEIDCMEEVYIYELENLPEEEEDDDDNCGGVEGLKMVGLSDQFQTVKSALMRVDRKKHVYALLGMAGIGKTFLAEKIFDDPQIQSHFEHRVWVKIGRKSRTSTNYARVVLAQLDPNNGKEDEKEIGECLKERLEGKKCLIVLDDVWEPQALDSLMSYLPEEQNGITQILFTARDGKVASDTCRIFGVDVSRQLVRFMNEEESKELLCKKVFGEEESLPSKLEKAAKKIAKKCEGLPLLIVVVADHLSKGDMTEEYWNEVAEEKNSVFKDALKEVSEVLFPSYNYLPQYLKMFFLYLGVFHPDCEIIPSNLVNMLSGEGWFLDTTKHQSLRGLVSDCLHELCSWSYLVLFKQSSISWFVKAFHANFKTCRLHCSWRHLCQREAQKNKFYCVLNGCVDASEEFTKGQRCLCLHNNILFAIEDVHDSVQLNCASSARSLLFFGPYHQYSVPIDVGFKLLRELDALNLRFYTFPTEILKLFQLKYLALTCNGEIPSTISKLFNLRVLIVRPHMSIKIRGAPSYIPIQIWDMQELEHVEILGKNLPPPHHIASFEKLSTLVGVNASICTILELFKKFPHVRKLGIQIELTPFDDDDKNLGNSFHCISMLEDLEILKCSIMNPELDRGFIAPATPSSLKFPIGLVKLHLSGMGFPWEYMNAIASLPKLQVLKLRSYAFRGPRWDMEGQRFLRLKFLLIEDSDLVQWSPGPKSFPELTYLSMKHCYKLQDLHWWPNDFLHKKIELVDCNPLAVTCVKQVQPSQSICSIVTVSSSFNDQNMTLKFEWEGNELWWILVRQ